jgi:hypothetical protein
VSATRNPRTSCRVCGATPQRAAGRPSNTSNGGVSGAKDRLPALDQLLSDARRSRSDVLVCWRLDRLGPNLKHLVPLLEELQALGIAFVSLNEGLTRRRRPASCRCTFSGQSPSLNGPASRNGSRPASSGLGRNGSARASMCLSPRRTRPGGQSGACGSRRAAARRPTVDAQTLAPGGPTNVHDGGPVFALPARTAGAT